MVKAVIKGFKLYTSDFIIGKNVSWLANIANIAFSVSAGRNIIKTIVNGSLGFGTGTAFDVILCVTKDTGDAAVIIYTIVNFGRFWYKDTFGACGLEVVSGFTVRAVSFMSDHGTVVD